MSNQYPSMQKELAARKAAAGYEEEPRARLGPADRAATGKSTGLRGIADRAATGKSTGLRGIADRAATGKSTGLRAIADKENRKRGIWIWFVVAGALFAVGLVISIALLPDEIEDSSPFDETTTDEEVIEYINERWSVDPTDYRTKIQLLSWLSHNYNDMVRADIGDWNMDVSQNIVIIKAECPEEADLDVFFTICEDVNERVEDSLSEAGKAGVPVLVLARWQGSEELLLVLINGSEYYSYLDE